MEEKTFYSLLKQKALNNFVQKQKLMEQISKEERASKISELLPAFLPEGKAVTEVEKTVKLEAYKQMYKKHPELKPTRRYVESFEEVVKRLGAEKSTMIAVAIETGLGYNMKTGAVYKKRARKASAPAQASELPESA